MAKTRTVELIAKLRNNMGPGLRNIASGAVAAATAIIATGTAAFAAAKKLSDYGAEIYDVASATGVAVEDVQALGYAFEQTGGSMSSMSGAIRGLNTFMRTAATGSAEYMNVLSDLGLEYDSLRAMEPAQAFIAITDAIGGLDNAMEKNIAATTVFGGRYAQQIVGALDQAEGSLATLTDQFAATGNAMSGEQIASLKAYSDAMTDLDFAMKKLTADALGPMLPKLQEMADKGIEIAKEVLPELIPMIENALNVMMDTLPTVIRLLGMAADGWETLSDTVKNGVGGSEAENLMNALTRAVETGAMTVEEATAEWERYTTAGRSTISTINGMLNPIAGMTNAITDASNNYGIFGEQQIVVNDGLNETALAAFRAAEGFDILAQSQSRGSTMTGQQIASLGVLAMAYGDLFATGSELAPEETPEGMIGGAGVEAGKLELTLKQILLDMKEFIKPLKEAKDILEKHSEMEEVLRQNVIERKMSEAEADQARLNALDKALAKTEQFSGAVIGAALNGKDAWNSFWSNMKSKIIQTVAIKGFMALLNFAAPGLGGAIGTVAGFLGFKGGGTVPRYAAAGGMTVPGSTATYGDKTPIMAEPGEVVLSRGQANDLRGGGSVTTVSVDYRPWFSSASASDVARMIPMIKKAMEKGNL